MATPSTLYSSPAAHPSGRAASRARGWFGALLELGKYRLTSLVVTTATIGYLLGALAQGGVLEIGPLVATATGTFLVAAAASALNQMWEVRWDRKMHRTQGRPLVTGEIGMFGALVIGGISASVGIVILNRGAGPLAGGLALITLLSYVLLYTPMKRIGTVNTIIGAGPGALPPVIGWAGATGAVEFGSWALFALVFLWQIPHFLAIGWIYRDDYARGGFRMLSVVDPSGVASGRMAVLYALALLPVSLIPGLIGISGWVYLIVAPILGAVFLLRPAHRFWRDATHEHARSLFLGSLVYLPLVFGLMLLDRTHIPRDVLPLLMSQ